MPLSSDFIHELKRYFEGDIRLDAASRILYSTDASIYQIEPLGVAIPKTQDDLHAAAELAAAHCVPILPRGAGTSLAGQAIGEALILDCSRWLDKIVAIDPEASTAIVEPGVILADLNRAAARHGLQFGPDPASAERATMGGVIGNNATGAHSILYGMTADHLLEADVILSDGSLATFGEWRMGDGGWKMEESAADPLTRIHGAVCQIRNQYASAIKQHFPHSWRNSAGYRLNYLLPWSPSVPPQWIGRAYPANLPPSTLNLSALLAGSEGTLAIIRRATVGLVPKPKRTILGILSYDSISAACDDVPRLLAFRPSAVELIPRMILRLAHSVPAYASQMGWLAGDPAALLVVEFSGDDSAKLRKAAERIGRGGPCIGDPLIASTAEEQTRVWNVRKVGLGILDSRPQAARPAAFIEDCAIPVERLGEFVREIERILAAHQTEGGIYAHASAGCLHIRPILNLKTSEGVRSMRQIAEATFALTLSLGGSMSSEHGDGIARGEWLQKTYGDEVLEAMRLLKRAADPRNILNPGKMLDAPPMDSHLRFGADYRSQAWRPTLHFNHENGLAGAIEQCNGQGVCRKSSGVMCPSYQATREEANSTRGRANLLRALIVRYGLRAQGDTGAQTTAHPGEIAARESAIVNSVFSALDLCLACKGCKSECPSGVDMAKLKFEFMHEYYKTHSRRLRDYLFGYFHITARILSVFAPFVNALTSMGAAKTLFAKMLGIAPQRPFPKFSWMRAKASRIANPACGKIIFLSDAFSRYVEPHVEQAAFNLLAACNYQVVVLPVVGAGAGLISKSFFAAAQRHARRVLDALERLDPERVLPIVGIEPSEVYCLKNDYIDLLPSRADEIASRAARVWLLDEFLLRADAFRKLRIANITKTTTPKDNPPKITLQPHCHQRAEPPHADGLPTGAEATLTLLQSLGFEVEMLDAACCGMAGTFGYEAEHYELSMKVGERALRSLHRGDNSALEVACTGAACRMQVRQSTGARARHPLEMVWEAIAKDR